MEFLVSKWFLWITLIWIIGGMIWALFRGFEDAGFYFEDALAIFKKILFFFLTMLFLPFIVLFRKETKPPNSKKGG